MPTAAELVAQLNALPAEEHADAIALLSNASGAVVKVFRSKQYAAGKKDGAQGGAEASGKLVEAQERVAELEGQLVELQAKQPDAAAIEERVSKRMQRLLDAEKQRADHATTSLRDKDMALTMTELLSALSAPGADGSRVRDSYFAVIKAEQRDRIRIKDDGTIAILQPDSEIAYDAADTKAAVKLLAEDLRKTIPRDFIVVGGEGGGGRGAGSYGAGTPRTVEAIKEQKRAAGIGPSL